MVRVFYTKNKPQWDRDKEARLTASWPDALKKRIAAYKDPADRQSRIIGKLLLLQLLEDFDIKKDLRHLKYTAYNKPYIDVAIDFSTAHSDGLVVCAMAQNPIGIDVERVKPIELKDFRDQLTTMEWQYIWQSKDRVSIFYEIWTRKEALLKATGRGVDIDLQLIDCTDTLIVSGGESYYFKRVETMDGYVCHLAVSDPAEQIVFKEFFF